MSKLIGFKVTGGIESSFKRVFGIKYRARAIRYLQVLEAKLAEANKVCDGEIWTNVELIYETRWDCPTARPAAAIVFLT